ncbi:protein pellino-like [Paramacrobiotus metropolitanus]|uniref:protein pellino-like n=1 Tax=Paramacrobiotus metropolitanus TaxID=2943436 RepID=UPI002445B221|nr:protein pellino-like [Paramacrobiotus metropolitanus]XP_055341591.1 protein pellino-like [Paramacrobiotus metropolitanus]
MENSRLDEDVYGQLIVLGYNGSDSVPYLQNGPSGASSAAAAASAVTMISTRYLLRRKARPNGVVPSARHYVVTDPAMSQSMRERRHFVSYVKSQTETTIHEYQSDPFTDMFQVGRSTDRPIDVTVKDTRCLDADAEEVASDARHPHSAPAGHAHPNNHAQHQQRDSTISRFACRLLVNRTPPFLPRVLAAGFDNHRNISLGEKAPKWITEGGMDGLTTNGVLIWHPPSWGDLSGEAPQWLEVSVRGSVLALRSSRSAKVRGQPLANESNVLRDGTLIDLCGVTLLFRSRDGLEQGPTVRQLEDRLALLNADRPQCPVGMNTLVIPKQRNPAAIRSNEQPYIYMTCGHVQGRHGWGDQPNKLKKCPICFKDGTIVRLCMGMEPGFYISSNTDPTHAFNPCGHMAPLETCEYWSRISFPHEASAYKPSSAACPFCISMLDTKCPFVRIIFP